MKSNEELWHASLEDIKNGYIEDHDYFTCLLCGEKIEKGIIYPVDHVLYEAQKYMVKHIVDTHGSVFEYLNSLDKKITGLSDHQSSLLGLFYQGKSDHEVQKELGIGSASTIRNHRFGFKEKERQSKIFLVLMDLLKERNKNAVSMVKPHKTATMVDDRYAITEDENEKLLRKYFPQGITGKLKTFSMQEKHKLVVLREIVKRFEPGRSYIERELNEILKDVYEDDYVAIRRYLIEYGFMDRNKDCSEYWVKGSPALSKTAEKIISGVYQIRNTQNEKIFINSGRNIEKLNGIKFMLKTGTHSNKTLQDEWNQYGQDAFVFEILESFEEDENPKNVTKELKKLEKKWIEKLQPFGEQGYNKK